MEKRAGEEDGQRSSEEEGMSCSALSNHSSSSYCWAECQLEQSKIHHKWYDVNQLDY
jgi:hypothetical protein